MTETTKQILSALAAAADGEARDLPLWPGAYRTEAIRAAAAEWAPYCEVQLAADPAGLILMSLAVRPESQAAGRSVLSELLNHAFLLSARQILTAEPHGE